MNYAFIVFVSFSIFIPGIIAMIRILQYDKAFIPFTCFIWLGCCNELLSYLLVQNGYHSTVNNNIYVLVASVLIVWFFQSMNLFEKQSRWSYILITIYIITWSTETFLLRTIHEISTWFRILYSMVTVLMSVSLINVLLLGNNKLMKEACFYICTGFIVHFTLKVLVEIFWMYGITDTLFQEKVFNILVYASLFTNLTYTVAALWISKKRPYSLQW